MYPDTHGQALVEKLRKAPVGQLVQKVLVPEQVAQEGEQLSQSPVPLFWNLPATHTHAPEVSVRSGEQLVQLLGNTEQVRQVEKQAVHTAAPTSTYPEAQVQMFPVAMRRWLTVLSHEEQLAAAPQHVRQRGEQS